MGVFHHAKLFIVETVGLDKDALHIYVALFVFLMACLAMRWHASSVKPWLVVLCAALAGEYFDVRSTLQAGRAFDLGNHWHDLWNTMLLPTVLVLTSRFTGVFQSQTPLEPDDRLVTDSKASD